MFFDAHSDIWCDVTTRRLRGETDILRKHHLPRLRKGGVEVRVYPQLAVVVLGIFVHRVLHE